MRTILSLSVGLVTCVMLDIGVTQPCDTACQWQPWNPWTNCSSTCGGGQRSRSRPLCCDTRLTVIECVTGCGVNVQDALQNGDCNTFCYNNGNYSNGCKCNEGNYGYCCQEDIMCGQPSNISNGGFSGSNYTYGQSIQYFCDDKYELARGNKTHICTKEEPESTHGYWDGDMPYCAFVASCESNPCLNGATCTNGHDEYACTCVQGWTGRHCEFDIQPPVHRNCPDNITIHTLDANYYASWTRPDFWDPFGNDVFVTSNYPTTNVLLDWGVYPVSYVADKTSNGLKAECVFTITILPRPCEPLPIPKNGAFACNGWNDEYTEVCYLFCEAGYDVPFGVDIKEPFVCGASGQWLSPSVNVSCSEINDPEIADPLHTFDGHCSAETSISLGIETKYMDLITHSKFSDICLATKWDDSCTAENVIIRC